jgi:hypothetical protein
MLRLFIIKTSALAYYEQLYITSVKSFIILTLVANVIKLFTAASYDFS